MKMLRLLVMAAASLIVAVGGFPSNGEVAAGYEQPIAGYCYWDCSPCETSAQCPFNTPCTAVKLCRSS